MHTAQNATWANPATTVSKEEKLTAYPETLANQLLLEKCRQGNTDALRELLCRFEGLIQGSAYRLTRNHEDAGDLVAETYLRLSAMIGSCRSAAALPTWISRVVSNALCDLRRRAQRTPAVSLDRILEESGEGCLTNYANQEVSPERYLEAEERKQLVRDAIRELPKHQQSIINLFYREEYTYEEISERMGIAVGTVKSRLNRAREALQQRLGMYQDIFQN